MEYTIYNVLCQCSQCFKWFEIFFLNFFFFLSVPQKPLCIINNNLLNNLICTVSNVQGLCDNYLLHMFMGYLGPLH